MTPNELRAARHSLGMTHRQFGHALGVQEQTARRWEIAAVKTSNRAPSETVLRLIRVLLATNPKAIDSAPAASGPREHSTCCSALMLAFFAQLNSDPAALSQAIAAARDCEETK